MALCADAEVRDGALVGDPTEGALVVLAAKGGVDPTLTREQYPRVATLPFDAAYKMMATFHAHEGRARARTSSAATSRARRTSSSPARSAPTARTARRSRSTRSATATSPRTSASARWACASWRPARRTSTRRRSTRTPTCSPRIDGLTLLAIVGIVDPPRPAAKAAIATAKAAGIQVRMITGDHAVTAEAIAHQLGIEGRAITGADFRAMSDDEAMRQIDGIGVIARVSPEDKVHLVDILRKKGHVVGHDRRRRERRAGPQEGRHRHRDGHHRDRGLQAGRGDDPDRRQLRHDREGGRPRARRLRQPAAVHPLPDGRPVRVHRARSSARRSSTSSAASRSCRSRPCGSTSPSTSSRPSASATASRARASWRSRRGRRSSRSSRRRLMSWLVFVGLVMAAGTLGVLAWARRQLRRRGRPHDGHDHVRAVPPVLLARDRGRGRVAVRRVDPRRTARC